MFIRLKQTPRSPVFENDEDKARVTGHLYSLLMAVLIAALPVISQQDMEEQ